MKMNKMVRMKKDKKKRGQLKIQEMAFMLMALVLFFVLAGLFALTFWSNGLRESANNLLEDRSLAVIESLSGTAEFICSGTRTNCIDEDKVINLINRKDYQNYWAFSSLSIIKSVGFGKEEKDLIECSLANYPNCEVYNIHKKSSVKAESFVESYVALCRQEVENIKNYEKCEIARLIAGTEIK